MDERLARALIDLCVPQFGVNTKNKNDSPSCRFEPRNLLSDPATLEYIGKKMAEVSLNRCSGSALVGMATSGIAWAALASVYSGLPMLYVRKSIEHLVSDKLIEGISPDNKKVILVDDLLFAGQSKREALDILADHGYQVTDIVVIIDRELQRKEDGPRLQDKYDLKLHTLITMSDIVDYMTEQNAISDQQRMQLISDYQMFDRWDKPRFVD